MKKAKKIALPVSVAVLLLFFGYSMVWAEEDCKDGALCRMDEAFEKHLDPSYITFGGGFNEASDASFEDLYYEGQVYKHLNWINTGDKSTSNHRLRLYLPIRIQIRQYSTHSSPVKTPSFNPGLRLYYWHRKMVSNEKDFSYLSFGLHHYSNGQSGPHYDPGTGEINTESGSFSSDYLELSYYVVDHGDGSGLKKLYKWFDWNKWNLRAYCTACTWEEDQTGYYEEFLLEYSGKKVCASCEKFKVQMQITVAHKFGRDYVLPGKVAKKSDNMQYRVEIAIKPKSWTDLSGYIRWDRGYDYYNIHYQEKMNRLQLGIAAIAF